MKTLNEIVNEYGDYVVKDGFMDFLEKPVSISVWDLEIGDKYFYIDTEGYINSETWQNDATDNLRRCIGNTFPTLKKSNLKRNAEKYMHRLSDMRMSLAMKNGMIVILKNTIHIINTTNILLANGLIGILVIADFISKR